MPGIGPFLNPQLQATDRVSRDVFRVSRSQKPPSDSDNGDNPFVVPQGRAVEVISEPAVFSQNIEPFNPPVELADGKCSYVQVIKIIKHLTPLIIFKYFKLFMFR